LSHIAIDSEQKAEEFKREVDQSKRQHSDDVDALVAELRELSDQLAQRTVLYSAQERRWRDTARTQESLDSEQKRDLHLLRGQVNQLREQYLESDRERVDALLSLRQAEGKIRELELQLHEQEERSLALNQELTEANSRVMALQQTVEHLRGADFDQLEQDLSTEIMKLRSEGRQREDQLLRKLTEAQTRIESDVSAKQKLSDEILRLQQLVDERNGLLRQLQDESSISIKPRNRYSLAADTSTLSSRFPNVNDVLSSYQSDITSSDFEALIFPGNRQVNMSESSVRISADSLASHTAENNENTDHFTRLAVPVATSTTSGGGDVASSISRPQSATKNRYTSYEFDSIDGGRSNYERPSFVNFQEEAVSTLSEHVLIGDRLPAEQERVDDKGHHHHSSSRIYEEVKSLVEILRKKLADVEIIGNIVLSSQNPLHAGPVAVAEQTTVNETLLHELQHLSKALLKVTDKSQSESSAAVDGQAQDRDDEMNEATGFSTNFLVGGDNDQLRKSNDDLVIDSYRSKIQELEEKLHACYAKGKTIHLRLLTQHHR
jgi:hypothetical protein